jgi:hypothetical protein
MVFAHYVEMKSENVLVAIVENNDFDEQRAEL